MAIVSREVMNGDISSLSPTPSRALVRRPFLTFYTSHQPIARPSPGFDYEKTPHTLAKEDLRRGLRVVGQV